MSAGRPKKSRRTFFRRRTAAQVHSAAAVDPGPADVPESERIFDEAPKHTFLWSLLSGWLLSMEAWLRSHGGKPLRMTLRAFWGLVALAGVFLLIGPVINKPLTLDDITGSASTATERWIAREFAADYQVNRGPDGELVAEVEERISAFFPDDTDEDTISRELATQYQGHALKPTGIRATLDGEQVTVRQEAGADRLTLTVDAGERLVGDHMLVLRYTLGDLAYAAEDEASGQPVDLLEWDVFGPSWPQALAGLDVTITLPEELNDRLIREPRGGLAWTIIGGSEWLEPEPGSGAGVTYRMTNDQRIPPHAQAWFTMAFEAGTFTMPPPSTLFLIQTWGPLAPLAFLLITLLFVFAARAVAWADARGRPWFVAQSTPPDDVSPALAAHILRRPRAMELGESLEATRKAPRTAREKRLVATAKVAHRTGRIGDLPRAWGRFALSTQARAQVKQGYRRVPRGFVRDFFIAAPLALTLVQWGLVRQLSHQAILSIIWWPVAFVLLSSLIAAIVLWVTLSVRPLTRTGALVKQHLLGIGVYAERTQLLARTTLNDPALPFAVLLERPRAAGRQVAALVEHELGERGVAKKWRDGAFLTWPRLIIRLLAPLLVVGTVVAVAVADAPDSRSPRYGVYSADVPGTLDTQVQSFESQAVLRQDEDGRAQLDVTERLTVTFSDESWRVPQFAHQYAAVRNGQDLGLTVTDVLLDGEPAPHVVERVDDTVLVRTNFTDVLDGTYDLQLDYTLESAAFAADARAGGLVDRVRWAALLEGWEFGYQWGDEVSPIRISLTVPEDLAAAAEGAGWISRDTRAADRARDWPESVIEFGAANERTTDRDDVEETREREDGAVTHTLTLAYAEGGWPLYLTIDDLGAAMDFPAGTFIGPDASALRKAKFEQALPTIIILSLAGVGVVLGGAGAVLGWRRRPAVFSPGALRDAVRWLAPAATLAAVIFFVWFTGDMPADHSAFPPVAWASLAAIVASIAGFVFTRGKRLRK